MEVKKLKAHLLLYLSKHNLNKKWHKVKKFLESDLSNHSLYFKKIIFKHTVLYSFRLDEKHRGICILQNEVIEVILFTNHYE